MCSTEKAELEVVAQPTVSAIASIGFTELSLKDLCNGCQQTATGRQWLSAKGDAIVVGSGLALGNYQR